MPNNDLPASSATPESAGLENALFGASDAANDAAQKPDLTADKEKEKTPGKSAGDEQEDDTEEETESEEDEGTDEEESTDDESVEESDEETPDDEEEESETYQLGGRSFANAQDALKEAQRIVGRNATLAGELRVKDTAISELKTQLDEAVRLNQEWKEWSDAQAGGDDKAKKPDPESDPAKIAETVTKRVREDMARESLRAQYKSEIGVVLELGNYDDVRETLVVLADKKNPMTGQNFTPYEAYDYACSVKGLENMRQPASQKTTAKKPVTAPKKVSRDTVKSAAARPGTSRNGTTPPARKQERSFAEEMLSEQIGNSL